MCCLSRESSQFLHSNVHSVWPGPVAGNHSRQTALGGRTHGWQHDYDVCAHRGVLMGGSAMVGVGQTFGLAGDEQLNIVVCEVERWSLPGTDNHHVVCHSLPLRIEQRFVFRRQLGCSRNAQVHPIQHTQAVPRLSIDVQCCGAIFGFVRRAF